MTTEPLEDLGRPSAHGLPEASLDNKADENSEDLPGEGPDSLPDDAPPGDIAIALAEQDVDQDSAAKTIATEQDEEQAFIQTDTFVKEDEDQASMQTATLMRQDEDQESMQSATSVGQNKDQASVQTDTSTGQDVEPAISMATATAGIKDESPDTPSQSQETPEEITSLLTQDPGILQMFVGFQNPVWDRLAENIRTSRSRTVSPSDSQTQEKISGKLNVPEGQPEIAPNADVPSVLPEDVQPSEGATDPSPSDNSGPDSEPMTNTKSVEQKAEGVKASNPENKATPGPTNEDLAADSRIPQAPPVSSSPGGSPPPSPDSCQVAPGKKRLDPNLYRPDVENDYMRSMTSLLGCGESSISSLTDILVWSDTATRMGVAVGILASGCSSPADRLQDEGPRLRTVASLLRSARSAFSSGVMSGTGSALRSVTNLLESMERRTMEGIRSAIRYLHHFTSRWARTGSNGD